MNNWRTIAERTYDLHGEVQLPPWEPVPGYDLQNALRAREAGRAETVVERIPKKANGATWITEKLKFKVTG